MTISRLMMAVHMRWRAALFAFLAVVAAGMLLTRLTPPTFIATAALMLDVRSMDPIAGSTLSPLAVSAYMATQADVVRSERVLKRAVSSLGMEADAESDLAWVEATQGRGDKSSWLSDRIAEGLQVSPARESNVITVRYSGKAAEPASAVVNAIVDAYIATTIELRAEPARQYDSFFEAQVKQLRSAVEKAQSKLSEHQQKGGVVAKDERMDIENARLAELSSQLVAAQAAAGEASSRQTLSRGQAEQSMEVLANPLISSLMGELARQESRLDELTISRGNQHPQVQESRAATAQLRSRIQEETRKVAASLNIDSEVLTGQVARLRAAVEEQRAKVLRAKLERERAEVLERDLENATLAYSAAFKRLDSVSLESQATQTNVSILKRASAPAWPEKPRVAVNAGVTLVLAVVAALTLALLREVREPRLRSGSDVEDLLGQTVLGHLPHHRASNSASSQWQRLVAPVPRAKLLSSGWR